MFSLQLYKVVHIIGLVLLMAALGGMALHAINGGTRQTNLSRKLVASMHGLGAFFLLLGGFGMLARLGIVQGTSWPLWLWAKLTIWVLLAVAIVVPYRRPALAKPLLIALPILGGIAAYLAIYKPG
jgi:hypothetical protein